MNELGVFYDIGKAMSVPIQKSKCDSDEQRIIQCFDKFISFQVIIQR